MEGTHLVERRKRDVVHLDPDRTLPVVLALAELGVRRGQAAEAVLRPEMLRVAQQVEDWAEVGRVRRKEAEEEREEGEVAFVADMVGLIYERKSERLLVMVGRPKR